MRLERKDMYIQNGKNKSTGILREIHYIKQGTYQITADIRTNSWW